MQIITPARTGSISGGYDGNIRYFVKSGRKIKSLVPTAFARAGAMHPFIALVPQTSHTELIVDRLEFRATKL